MKLNQRGKVNERHKGLLSMRQKAFYTHPSLFQPQGISWYRKFIIQRRRLRTDSPFMWVNTPFRIFPFFFYQHQLVIKREFTGKGVLAEVFCISSVQCGNKFRHKFQLLILLLLQSRLNYVGKQIQCPLDFFSVCRVQFVSIFLHQLRSCLVYSYHGKFPISPIEYFVVSLKLTIICASQ